MGKEKEKKEEPKKDESWIEKMLSGMKSALGIILKPLSLILKAIPLIGSLFSSIGGLVLEVIGNNVLKVFGLLIKPIAKLMISLSTSLIEKLIVPFIGFVSRQILGLAKKIPGIAALAEVMTTGAGLGLAAIGVGAAGLYATQKYEEYGDEIEIGPKAAQIAKQMDGLREQYQKSRQNPHTTPEALNKIKEKFNELASQYYAEKVKYEQEVLVPRMKEAGYQVSGTDENKSLKGLDNKELRMTGTVYGQKNTPVSTAPLKFIKLDGEGRGNVASTLDFVRAVKIPEKLKEGEEYVTGAAEEKFQEIKVEYLKNHPETNEILNKFNTVSEELNNLTNSMIEKSKEASTTVINKVNNIGNLKDEIKQLQPSRARDDDSTIIKVITNSIISV